MANAKKEIELLSELEHVLKRPEIYISSTSETEELCYYLDKDDILRAKMDSVNVGMYRLFEEIFDNSVDEHKRLRESGEKRKNIIKVTLNKNRNELTIEDNGDGFEGAIEKNEDSGETNVKTAYCYLRSGSNFSSEEVDDSLIGLNGVGGSLVNMLSDEFSVKTINEKSKYYQKWHEFEEKQDPVIKKKKYKKTGTEVSFIPRKSVFGKSKFDEDHLRTQLAIRQKCIRLTPRLSGLEVRFFVREDDDTREVEIPEDIFPEPNFVARSNDLLLIITPRENTTQHLLSINSTICQNDCSPVRYVHEIMEDKFDSSKAKNHYTAYLFMNLPQKLLQFGDQNKTKYAVPINKIRPHMKRKLKGKLGKKFTESEVFDEVEYLIEQHEQGKQKKKISSQKRNSVISKKYFPASSKKDCLFIVEGESATGSILQGRDPKRHGVYALKGKLKNCRKLKDLRTNKEIMELISVLDLSFDSAKSRYKSAVITTDADPDGYHIAFLIVNLFQKWFPKIVESGKLLWMRMPLMKVGTGKNIKYFYEPEEVKEHSQDKGAVYLKGLGSLSIKDWDYIMNNMKVMKIEGGKDSEEILEIIFGKSSKVRRQWINKILT